MQGLDHLFGFAIAVAVLGIGVFIFWRLKFRAIRSYLELNPDKRGKLDSLGSFFLGGGKVGSLKTTNNNWGLCFAFANSIWYYAYLGYYYGLYIFLLQAAWSVALVFIARYLARYLAATNDGTVHGFIEHHYGARAALLAATATLIGYTLNIGFEIFYSSHLLLVSVGSKATQYELLLAIVIALFVGGYCALGGYIASVETDLIQKRSWRHLHADVVVANQIYAARPLCAPSNSFRSFSEPDSYVIYNRRRRLLVLLQSC